MDCEKFEAMKILSEDYGYKPIHTNIMNQSLQDSIKRLHSPRKFGIDKENSHLSTLILNNVLSRKSFKEFEQDSLILINFLLMKTLSIS